MEPIPSTLDEVVAAMRCEWRSTVGTNEYLEALERRALELASSGPLGSRLNETGGEELAKEMLELRREAFRLELLLPPHFTPTAPRPARH
jgi:hypothetical protein